MAELVPRSRLQAGLKASMGEDTIIAKLATDELRDVKTQLRRMKIPEEAINDPAKVKLCFRKHKEEELLRHRDGTVTTTMMKSEV